jgi:hypothetical protein
MSPMIESRISPESILIVLRFLRMFRVNQVKV